MKRFTILLLISVFATSAVAIEQGQVMYSGGTLPIKEGVIGHLDTSSETALVFVAPAAKISIPYSKIETFQYTEELARHLGVLPTIAVGLLKHRQRRHFFRIAFLDEHDVAQVAVLEVSKDMPRTLRAVLQVRTPNLCKPKNPCGL
jgi:hypothetical protein